MAVVIPSPPYRSPMIDASGRLTPIWEGFFKQFFLRVGGTTALSNTELEALQSVELNALQAEIDAAEVLIAAQAATISALTTQLSELQESYENTKGFR